MADFFTTAEFKCHEGIAGGQHDVLIGNFAARASAAVRTYLNREPEPTDYTEELDGSGANTILVRQPPIRAITSLKVTTDRQWSSVSAVDSSYYVYEDSGIITLLPSANLGIFASPNAIFFKGIRNVQVIYSGGYAAVPEPIKEASILLAAYWFNRRRQAGLLSTTTSGTTITFQARTWPDEIRALLNPYRLLSMAGSWDS